MGDMTTDRYFDNVLNAMRFWTKRGFSHVDKTPPAFMTMKSKVFDSTDVSDTGIHVHSFITKYLLHGEFSDHQRYASVISFRNYKNATQH